MENFEIVLGLVYIFFTGLGALHIAITVVAAIAIMTLLGSAFIAATIAETRGHTMLKHFFGGLLLPIAYPIMINKKLLHIVKEQKSRKKELELGVQSEINMSLAKVQYEAECKKLAKKNLPTPDFIDWFNERKNTKDAKAATTMAKNQVAKESKESDAEQVVGIDRGFIENIAVDNIGNRQGPFQLVLSDGRELIAQRITNIMDEVATFEIIDNNGVTKNIRFKYTNITSIEQINQ